MQKAAKQLKNCYLGEKCSFYLLKINELKFTILRTNSFPRRLTLKILNFSQLSFFYIVYARSVQLLLFFRLAFECQRIEFIRLIKKLHPTFMTFLDVFVCKLTGLLFFWMKLPEHNFENVHLLLSTRKKQNSVLFEKLCALLQNLFYGI
jgi:hypothetical protein